MFFHLIDPYNRADPAFKVGNETETPLAAELVNGPVASRFCNPVAIECIRRKNMLFERTAVRLSSSLLRQLLRRDGLEAVVAAEDENRSHGHTLLIGSLHKEPCRLLRHPLSPSRMQMPFT